MWYNNEENNVCVYAKRDLTRNTSSRKTRWYNNCMQIWFIGRTLASQAGEAGSTPVICLFFNDLQSTFCVSQLFGVVLVSTGILKSGKPSMARCHVKNRN